jgi:hypothetical protein
MKMYGPMNALNTEDESSCWYSDGEEGSTQSLTINFGRQVTPSELKLQFQAGFSAETCQLYLRSGSEAFELIVEIEPEDTHKLQSFPLDSDKTGDALKLVFDECTDFYGRVTVYQLGVWGKEATKTDSK